MNTVYIKCAYGPLKTNIPYKLQDKGYDYFKVAGVYVPKNLVSFRHDSERERDLPEYEDFV